MNANDPDGHANLSGRLIAVMEVSRPGLVSRLYGSRSRSRSSLGLVSQRSRSRLGLGLVSVSLEITLSRLRDLHTHKKT